MTPKPPVRLTTVSREALKASGGTIVGRLVVGII